MFVDVQQVSWLQVEVMSGCYTMHCWLCLRQLKLSIILQAAPG
jgi:hypothetical protein